VHDARGAGGVVGDRVLERHAAELDAAPAGGQVGEVVEAEQVDDGGLDAEGDLLGGQRVGEDLDPRAEAAGTEFAEAAGLERAGALAAGGEVRGY